jgi:hypothetical protein
MSTRRLLFALLVSSALSFSSCVSTRGAIPLLTPTEIAELLAIDLEKYKDAPAVVLRFEDSWLLHIAKRDKDHWEREVHKVVRVRSMDGVDRHATVRIGFGEKSELLHFAARTISPDGSVTEVPADQLFDDTFRVGDDSGSSRSFQFPRVEPGAVLEYRYRIRNEGWRTTIQEQIAGRAPIVDYRFEMLVSQFIKYEMRLLNSGTKIETDKQGNYKRLRFAMRDVAKTKSEDWDPHWTAQSPWWQFRTKKLAFRRAHYKVTQTWADAYKWTVDKLNKQDERFFEDADLSLGKVACDRKSVRCLADTALDRARTRTWFAGFDRSLWNARAIKKVLDTERADNFEKALYVGGMLAKAGVDVEWAFMSRRFTRTIDKKVPVHGVFNHMLLRLPAQAGLDKPIFLDPSCEYCGVGELPEWSRGGEALVVRTSRNKVINNDELHAESSWEEVTGHAPATGPRTDIVIRCVLEKTGDMECEETRRAFGRYAMFDAAQVKRWEKGDEEKVRKRQAREVLDTAALKDFKAVFCNDRRSRCEARFSYRVPSWAAVDGDDLVVPFGVVRHGWHDEMTEKERKLDVVFRRADVSFSEVRFKLPAGYRGTHLPKNQHESSGAVDADLRFAVEGDEVVMTRTLTLAPGVYDKGDFAQLRMPLRAWADAAAAVAVVTAEAGATDAK